MARQSYITKRCIKISWILYAVLFVAGTFICAYFIALYNYPERVAERQIDKITAAADEANYDMTATEKSLTIEFRDFDGALEFCEKYLPNKPMGYGSVKKLDMGDEFTGGRVEIDLVVMSYTVYFNYIDATQKVNGYLYK